MSASQAILSGLANDGGLYVPEQIPQLSDHQWRQLSAASYPDMAARILHMYFPDFALPSLEQICRQAYAGFPSQVAPVRHLHDQLHVMELFHGPTLAFKDMALQVLPGLMSLAMQQEGCTERVLILVATSGDTGKAALEGFADKQGTAIAVFYPDGGVSPTQRLQMVTQQGRNVAVYAVEGNFDDCQRSVKALMNNGAFLGEVQRKGYRISSANSINIGRLIPQVAYYCHAYFELVRQGVISFGEPADFVVPTGNFGNILAAWYAKRMGLPAGKLVCASNANHVLADLFQAGGYDARRALLRTGSPSMDILVCSNLERYLFELCGRDSDQLNEWMHALTDWHHYSIDEPLHARMAEDFYGDWLSDEDTALCIAKVFQTRQYLMDPHTAVGYGVYERYAEKTGAQRPAVLVSTASPYKFSQTVLEAIEPGINAGSKSESFVLQRLKEATGQPVPSAVEDLTHAPIRHLESLEEGDMGARLLRWLSSNP